MIKKFGKEKGKLSLPQVTLVSASSVRINETILALKKSMRKINYADVIFFTHENLDLSKQGIRVIQIPKLDYNGYSFFVSYELTKHINTNHVLVVQHDGYVINPRKWDDSFLKYDYIGAPWKENLYFTNTGKNVRVGNGGFSLRSKKLLDAPTKLNLEFHDNNTGFYHEDGFLCVHNREILEENGIQFAPVEIASRFSRERWCRDSKFFPFGFHSNRRNLFAFLQSRTKKLFSKITK